MIWFK